MATTPPSSEVTSRPPLAKITRELVQPPSRVYLTLDDRLYIRSRNSLAGVELRIAGRLLKPDGWIVPFNFDHTPATNRSASLERFQMAEGFLLSCIVFPSAGAPSRRQTFAEVGFLRGLADNASVVDVLARDYVSEAEPLAFPGARIRSSVDGRGALRSLTGTDPAAGAEITEAVPADALWRLRSMVYALVTDATAVSRVSRITLDDGAAVYAQSNAEQVQSASLTLDYTAASFGAGGGPSSLAVRVPLPEDVLLAAGHQIATDTLNIQAGDNYAAPQFLVEEWIQD